MNDKIRAEVSDWAESLAQELATFRVNDLNVHPMLYAATVEPQIAYEVLVALSRTVALVLRPTGHAGGPIGIPAIDVAVSAPQADLAWQRAAQLVGCAASDDADLVDALARAALGGPNPLDEARATLWAILEILAAEPVAGPPPPPEGTPDV